MIIQSNGQELQDFKVRLENILLMTDLKEPSYIMATEKNKKPIVTPHEVTISDFTIGFSVVDLVGNEVWLGIFFLKCGFFPRLKSEK